MKNNGSFSLFFAQLLILIFCLISPTHLTVFSNSFQLCVDQCVDRNLAIPLSANLRWRPAVFNDCDYSCHIDACQTGCKDLEAAESTCDQRCSSTNAADSCFQGCFAVSNILLHQVQYLLQHVTVESRLDPLQGILLSWTFSDSFTLTVQEISAANIRWVAQTRAHSNVLKEGNGWKWTEFPPGSFKESASEVVVAAPVEESSEIQVRLAAIWRNRTIVSRSFLQTISGVPYKIKKPELLTCIQVSSTSLLVCWQSDTNGHLTRDTASYRVQLWKNDEIRQQTETTTQCHLFRGIERNLSEDNAFLVKVFEVEAGQEFKNENLLEIKVAMKEMDDDEPDARKLLFTNGTNILKMADPKDFLMIGDVSTVPFSLPKNQEISAMATISKTRLVVGLTDGSIFALNIFPPNLDDQQTLENVLENSTTVEEFKSEQSLIREPDGTGIVQLVVDAIQQKVYAVRNQSGIIRCSFKDCLNATVLTTNSVSYIERIAVDAWNGFLYYSIKDGDVFVATLFPSEAPSTYSFNIQRRLAQLPPISTMEVDFYSQQLIAVLKNGTLVAMDLVNQSVSNIRSKLQESESYSSVLKAAYVEDNLFWISKECGDEHGWESCLYGEEREPESGIVHLNRFLFAGKVVDLAILNDPQKPAYLLPPEDIGIIVAGKEGRATWQPPISLPFQASGSSWRNLKYNYKLVDSASGTVLDFSDTRELGTFLRTAFFPATNYTVFVQSCVDREFEKMMTCSKPAAVSWTTPAEFSGNSTQLTALIYSDASDGENLSTFDLLGRKFINDGNFFPNLSTNPPDVVSFDNATKTIYVASRSEISIFRVFPSKLKYRFLDYLTINHLTILPSKAMIVFSTAYQIIQYKLTSTFDRIIYQCGSETCGEVVGLASDDSSSTIFYLLQFPNGTVTLHGFNTDQLVSTFISSTASIPAMKQLIFTVGIFVFISIDGKLGVFDRSLSKIHYNFDVVHPQVLVPWTPFADQTVSFNGDLQTGSANSGLLEWKMSREYEEGTIVYKIQLFKDRLGGERTVDLTLTNSYSITNSVLENWPSQQKFDAIVDAITPWTVVSLNATGLSAPTKPPTAPRNVKMFVTQQKTVDGARAIIDVFWDGPAEWNGEMLGFVVNCSVTDGTSTPNNVVQNVSAKGSPTYSFSVKSGKVSCAVAATNQQNLVGKFSDVITVDSSDVRPLVRLFAIDSTDNLIAISNWSTIWDGVRVRRQNLVPQYQGMAFVDNNLYAIRKEDTAQPFAVMLDVNNIENVIHKVPLTTESNQIDAVTSDWVGNRLLFVAGHDLFQIALDTFESATVATSHKILSLSSGAQDAKQLLFDPFANVAYLLTKNGSLFRLDLVQDTEQNLGLSLECLKSQTVVSVVADFKWNQASSPIIYALTWNGIISFDPTTEKCSEVNISWDKFGDRGIKSILSIALADTLFVFGTATELIIYDRTTSSPLIIPVQNTPLKQVLAQSQSSQPYPERSCFQLPAPETIRFNVSNEGRTGAFLNVVEPSSPTPCQNISFPPTQYEVFFRRTKTDKLKHFRSISNHIHIENGILDKETDYDVYLSWFNRYYTYKDQTSDMKTFRTGYGYPTNPRDSAAYSLTPDTILLYWKLPLSLNAPKNEIKYRISQQSSSLATPVSIGAKQFENGSFSSVFSDIVSCEVDPCQAKIANLRPASDYKFWVTAFHISRLSSAFSEDQEAVSHEAPTRTVDIPGTLRLDNATSDSLMLRWNFLEPATIPQTIDIQYRLSGSDASWTSSPNSTFDPRSEPAVNITIPKLRSSTAYDYRFVATYSGKYSYDDVEKVFIEQFYQPTQQGRTKAGSPSAPSNVEITKERAFWILKWKTPENDGGAPIVSYAVEYRPNRTSEWEIAERGIPADKLWWKLDKPSAYSPDSQFRVRAANSEGFGPYGSTQEIEMKEESNGKAYYFILWIAMIAVFAILTTCLAAIFFVHKNQKKEKIRKMKVNKVIKLDDLNFESSEIPKPFQNDLKNLPHVSKEYVMISDKIGQGSFGEVYRGDAWNLPLVGSRRIPVAVKTLREGHSNEDKIKFIKEAILMNNFDHPNIVKLLGVCFDSEPHFIVLELMEGGDLQNFLRSCRPHESVPSQLSLNEIFAIMIDVGRGCAYLEMNKHVHRDLAARNCLITSKSSTTRVTKIADFGLARQMYLNEYYRVRGEDFLPLRWLAVESALDGVFTTKTDVWSYGVLCWEVLTLGEQPYREMMNSMILPHLRQGRRLEMPYECPAELFSIISSCWDANPDKRPSFAEIVRQLEALHNKPAMKSTGPFPSSQYHNNGFDDSQDSIISQTDHMHRRQSNEIHRFDKSEPTRRGFGLPLHLRQRAAHSASGGFPGLERPDSSFSGQTEITTCDDFTDDYEIPRSNHTPSSVSLSDSNGYPLYRRSPSPTDSKKMAKISRV